jgi:Leucine-rich repeat (LRR) protein
MDLYNYVSGPFWQNKTGWMRSGDVCGVWIGIVCGKGTSVNRVQEINLSGFGLQGTLQHSMVNLDALMKLNLNNNNIYGSLPDWLGSLTSLNTLALGNSMGQGIHGTIPESLGGLTNLQWLDLSSNGLTGDIPPSFANLTKLGRMDVSNNYLTGPNRTVPAFLENIGYLYMQNNSFAQPCPIPDWLKHSVDYNCLLPSDVPESDFTALLDMYKYLNGAQWANKDYWMQPGDVCKVWNGVKCGLVNGVNRITELDLGDNELLGTLPESLGKADALNTLVLWKNNITGTLPDWLFNITSLTTLSIGLKYGFLGGLTGTIPMSIGNLTNLESLVLSTNELTGDIPCCVANLKKLTTLNLAYNRLNSTNGSVPDFLQNIPHLDLVGNNYIGPCPKPKWLQPSVDFQCPLSPQDIPLEEYNFLLDLYNEVSGVWWLNQLNWMEPGNVCGVWNGITCQASHITGVDLTNNKLQGTLPNSLFNVPYLQTLKLGSNALVGQFPNISNATFLEVLDLSKTILSGSLPDWIGNLTKLTSMAVGVRYATPRGLTGTIPMSIGNLTNLVSLDLSNNGLTGDVPCCVANLHKLSTLRLTNNFLNGTNGTVPSFLESISDLEIFNNSYVAPCPRTHWLEVSTDYFCPPLPPGPKGPNAAVSGLSTAGKVGIVVLVIGSVVGVGIFAVKYFNVAVPNIFQNIRGGEREQMHVLMRPTSSVNTESGAGGGTFA